MSLDYTKLTHQSILDEWNNRILADERYKNLSKASIYSFFQEMFSGVMDLTNYYIQRTAEENYLDTAKLDSSVIKLSHNLGYNPKRAVPAVADISLNIRGPLPKTVQKDDVIWLNNETLTFSFNGHDYMLDACYSYKLTEDDIARGQDPSWTKKIRFAVNGYESQKEGYITLDGKVNSAATSKLHTIKVVQGKKTVKVLDSITYSSKVGQQYQWYDIDDLKFSNYYGIRDPFAFKNGEYNAKYGLCKVGIGTDQTSALKDPYEIEDEAVELNKNIKIHKTDEDENKTDEDEKGPHKVVCIRSNYDKTVRLYFGNGIDTSPGLTNTDQSIYVQYFVTDGSEANYPDAVGSQMRTVGKVYASGVGRVTNISNNVTFLFESSIHGGTDFEARDAMKRNAKIYFASNAKLITLPDFMSYLLTISDPINVKHAIAYGENQLEDRLGEHDAGRTNLIMYCLFSDIYRETNGLYRPINVFDEQEDLSSSSLYIDYSTYMSHLFDYVSFLLYPKGTTQDQYTDRSTFGQWALQVRADAEDRMMINTKLISMPPLFHYYDCVGDIQVDRHVDLSKFKDELENDLYKWLAQNTTFKSQIFKSDIYNQILKHAGAKRANIDIKVSELIKGTEKTYRFEPGDVKTNKNILIVPQQDIRGNDMRDILKSMVGRDITLIVQAENPIEEKFRIDEVSVDPDNVYLSLNGNPTVDDGYYFDIVLEEDSFFTKNRMSSVDSKLIYAVERWITGRPVTTSTEERPIPLPYEIEFDAGLPAEYYELEEGMQELLLKLAVLRANGNVEEATKLANAMSDILANYSKLQSEIEDLVARKVVREETFRRVGANSFNINENLSEESFYFMLRDAIQSGDVSYDTAKRNFNYVYPALKQIFDDNILDDNNNIVNYTSDRDIPVVRLRFRYVYAQ